MSFKSKQNKTKNGRRRNGGGAVVRISGQTLSFNIQQTTGGNGGFSDQESKGPSSASNTVVINPFNIGGRLYYFASLFDEWKLHKISVHYEPYIGPTGSPSTPSGAQNSGGLLNRAVAMCFVGDPATAITGYNACVAAGGVQFRTCERRTLLSRGFEVGNWLYTSTSTPTAITAMDYRQTSPGNLCMAFQDNSTTNNTTYGGITIRWTVSFRSPLTYGNPLGVVPPSLPGFPRSGTDESGQSTPVKVASEEEREEEKVGYGPVLIAHSGLPSPQSTTLTSPVVKFDHAVRNSQPVLAPPRLGGGKK